MSLSLGLVSSANPDSLCVQSDSHFVSIPSLSPWGVVSVPPQQAQAAVLSEELLDFCIGSPQSNPQLLPGELLLYSSGGASILLAQNGDVIINGQVFPKEVS